uniref:Uncharacterized protein n=1 Tax=Picea sitchensis TaxID=3332 RepID=A9NN47_PICSI|nr:unknown [Picea sitchensis]
MSWGSYFTSPSLVNFLALHDLPVDSFLPFSIVSALSILFRQISSDYRIAESSRRYCVVSPEFGKEEQK